MTFIFPIVVVAHLPYGSMTRSKDPQPPIVDSEGVTRPALRKSWPDDGSVPRFLPPTGNSRVSYSHRLPICSFNPTFHDQVRLLKSLFPGTPLPINKPYTS